MSAKDERKLDLNVVANRANLPLAKVQEIFEQQNEDTFRTLLTIAVYVVQSFPNAVVSLSDAHLFTRLETTRNDVGDAVNGRNDALKEQYIQMFFDDSGTIPLFVENKWRIPRPPAGTTFDAFKPPHRPTQVPWFGMVRFQKSTPKQQDIPWEPVLTTYILGLPK